MEITNVHIEQLAILLNTLGEVQHPMLAFKVAMLRQTVDPVVEAIAKAREPVREYQAYTQKRDEVCQVHAEKDAAGNPKKERISAQNQQGWVDRYVIPDMDAFVVEVGALEKEYAAALEAETTRQKTLLELLMAPAELEFKHKIKYSWCKNVLTGNKMALLMSCGILVVDEDLEDKPSETEKEEPSKPLEAVEDAKE